MVAAVVAEVAEVVAGLPADRLDRRRATGCAATANDEAATVEQRAAGSLVIDAVRRPGAPAVGARVVDPHLLSKR